jgi:hypothetical protein
MLNLSDKVKILDLFKGGMSLAEVGQYSGKNVQGQQVKLALAIH